MPTVPQNTSGYAKETRSDIYMMDPRSLIVDWRRNLSRNGEEPVVDEGLISLARDMMPKMGDGSAEDGSSGQLNPILCRLTADRRPEVLGGFRRMKAALYLIESGLCPEFRVKYTLTKMSDAEAALVNLSENINREDPKPIQTAYAIRGLIEDHGMALKIVAGRLKKSETWCVQLMELVQLPSVIQASVTNGQTTVSAALELAEIPASQQVETFNELKEEAEKEGKTITPRKVKEKRREAYEAEKAATIEEEQVVDEIDASNPSPEEQEAAGMETTLLGGLEPADGQSAASHDSATGAKRGRPKGSKGVKTAMNGVAGKTATLKPIPRTMKQIKTWIEGKTGTGESLTGKNFALYLLDWIDGVHSDTEMEAMWDECF